MSNTESQPFTSTRQIDFKKKTYTLLRIPVVFHNISKFALLDTGACGSFISDQYLATIPDNAVICDLVDTTRRTFQSATGETIGITGTYELKMHISKNYFVKQIFYVLPKLDEQCILGIDFLTNNNASIDVLKKEISLGDDNNRTTIKLNSIRKQTFPLYRIIEKSDEQNFNKHVAHIENKSFRNEFVALLASFSSVIRNQNHRARKNDSNKTPHRYRTRKNDCFTTLQNSFRVPPTYEETARRNGRGRDH